ncbi:unnamed protein product, partial [Mesorhabditis belari]|uniref:Uncharacterized protein n=1 Tax=Mesorhabditis belari TaxID=2138241 RepID=A0AAF3ERA9_9BILA
MSYGDGDDPSPSRLPFDQPPWSSNGNNPGNSPTHLGNPDDWAGVPVWAVYLFAGCALLIGAVLLLDYCVIRRNALGNTCCARSKQKRSSSSAHAKRSTNMLLNKMTRVPPMDPEQFMC